MITRQIYPISSWKSSIRTNGAKPRWRGARVPLFLLPSMWGVCWWQTETSPYGIKETPYKDGKGDLLEEIVCSCRKYGLKLGVYVSPSDGVWGAYLGGGGKTADPAKQEAYNQIYRQQLTEVLSRCGDIYEVWFDGSTVIDMADILQTYAKDAMILQSPYATIRWTGSEDGKIPYPLSSCIRRDILKTGISTGRNSDVNGDVWAPLEVDTPLYKHYWFWGEHKEKHRKSLEELMDCYYMSVGRGGAFLLNASPNVDGLISDGDMALYKAFGDEIERRFSVPAGAGRGRGAVTEIALGSVTEINHVILDEAFSEGERIRGFRIEAYTGSGWQTVYAGSLVGRRHIAVFSTVIASRVRVTITEHAEGLLPLLKWVAVYNVTGVDIPALLGRLREEVDLYDTFRKDLGEWAAEAGQDECLDLDLTPCIPMAGKFAVDLHPDAPVAIEAALWLDGFPSSEWLELDKAAQGIVVFTRSAVVTPESTVRLQITVRADKAAKGNISCSFAKA